MSSYRLTELPINEGPLQTLMAAVKQLMNQDLQYLNLSETDHEMIWTSVGLNARALHKAREMRMIIDVPFDIHESARKFCEVTDSELTPATVADYLSWLVENQPADPDQLVMSPEGVRLTYDYLAYVFCTVSALKNTSPEELAFEMTNPNWDQPMHLSTLQRVALRQLVKSGKLV